MLATVPVLGQNGVVKQQQQQSVTDAVNGGLEFGEVLGVDANNWANKFKIANTQTILTRVGAVGNPSPSGNVWTASNTKINHSLGKVPVGWIVVYQNKIVDIIAGTSKPDAQFIYLTTSDDTAETTLLIF